MPSEEENIMKYDTAGNKIIEPILTCNCGLTGGCERCNPFLKQRIKMTKACSDTIMATCEFEIKFGSSLAEFFMFHPASADNVVRKMQDNQFADQKKIAKLGKMVSELQNKLKTKN